jgi:hypothetical protein
MAFCALGFLLMPAVAGVTNASAADASVANSVTLTFM